MRRVLKNAAFRSFRSAGLFRVLAQSERRRRSLLILCYHGIALQREHIWNPAMYLSPERFRRRLQLLRDFAANVLPLGEALSRLHAGTLPDRSVAITFDDGFFDFRAEALPALQSYGYPSTVYVTTHYSRYPLPIFNLIAPYMLAISGRETIDVSDFGGSEEPASIRTADEQRGLVKALREWADSQQLDTPGKNEVARTLAQRLGLDYDALVRSRVLQILSPEEITAASRAGVAIELHTHRHRTPRDRDLFVREIVDNRDRIREMTGRDPCHFCYPSGDFAIEFIPWLQECGVESATTCERGLARAESNPWLLPRLLDQDDIDEAVFESWLGGFRI